MPDFLFLPSNIKMRAEMGCTAWHCSSAGNANTGQTSNPHRNIHTHIGTHRYGCTHTCTYQSRTNCEEETRQFECPSCCDDKLGAEQALQTNTEQVHATSQGCSCLHVFKSNQQSTKFFSHSNSSYPKYMGGRETKADRQNSLCVSPPQRHSALSAAAKRGFIWIHRFLSLGGKKTYKPECLLDAHFKDTQPSPGTVPHADYWLRSLWALPNMNCNVLGVIKNTNERLLQLGINEPIKQSFICKKKAI